MPPPVSDVIVLGAGVAGLMAARDIATAGRSVRLVEARDRVGGRIHTVYDPATPVPIERGAEFVHGADDSFRRLLREAGLAIYDVGRQHWHFHNQRLTPLNDFWQELHRVMKRLSPPPKQDYSFAEFLRRRCRGVPAKLKALARTYVEGFDAAFIDRISATSLADAQQAARKNEGEKHFRMVGGYVRLVDWLRKEIESNRVRLHLSTAVSEIRWRDGHVEVVVATTTGAGGGDLTTFGAKRIVVTLPLGVLKGGTVRFVPELPDKTRALAGLEVSPVVKLSMCFSKPFWEQIKPARSKSSLEDLTFVHADEAVPTWWTQLPVRSPLLTGWAGGPAARALSGKPRSHVTAVAIAALTRIMHVPMRTIESSVENATVSDWQSDPFSRGAYSYLAVHGGDARRQFAKPVRRTLFFAGEATSSEASGTVPGAVETGRRVAKEVLRSF